MCILGTLWYHIENACLKMTWFYQTNGTLWYTMLSLFDRNMKVFFLNKLSKLVVFFSLFQKKNFHFSIKHKVVSITRKSYQTKLHTKLMLVVLSEKKIFFSYQTINRDFTWYVPATCYFIKIYLHRNTPKTNSIYRTWKKNSRFFP